MTQSNVSDRNDNDGFVFLFGVKSYDDMSGCNASYETMNDIDIVYDTYTREYILSFETIYDMSNEQWCEYFKYLLKKIADWLEVMQIPVDHSKMVDIEDVIGKNYIISDSLLGVYYKFKSVAEYYIDVGFRSYIDGDNE